MSASTKIERNYLPLSDAQFGVWVAQELDRESPAFNIGEYIEIRGPIAIDHFETAVRNVVNEADVLRIRVVETDGGPRQFIVHGLEWKFPILDVSGADDPRFVAERWMLEDMDRAVDMTCEPLFGYALFRLAPDRFYWYARYHHICNDGFGRALLAQRVATQYTALVRGEECTTTCRVSLLDVLGAEHEYQQSEQFGRDREFFARALANRAAPVTLSGKRPSLCRGFIRSSDHVSSSATQSLLALGKRFEASVPRMLVALVALYLHRMTATDDVVLGVALEARTEERMRHAAGMVAKVLPIRLKLEPQHSFGNLIQQAAAMMRETLRHQRYSAEKVHHDIGLSWDDSDPFGTVVNVMHSITTCHSPVMGPRRLTCRMVR